MDFATRLAAARKERGLTQQALADRVGIHVTQIRRYEAGTSSPTLDVLAKIALSMNVTTDSLVFGEHDRDPDEDLRLSYEATRHLDPDEREMVKGLIEAVLLKHEARRWAVVS
ncbi:MAG: helix-turn-helix transcriptional regulator [Acidimicrobiales bacterium]|jgi:transcriptional regulator with XRE-family HTH domain